MAERYRLRPGLFLHPTPLGAYQAIRHGERDAASLMLRALLKEPASPPLDMDNLVRLSGLEEEAALQLLARLQQAGWVEGFRAPRQPPAGAMDQLAPAYLGKLSSAGRALLADNQGFYVAKQGFNHEVAEELAALSAGLINLNSRYAPLLQGNLKIGTAAWAVVDGAGNSRIGVWPLHVGELCFALVLADQPQLNHPHLVPLVWALMRHYG